MTRKFFIEQVLRQVYGGWITDDNTITTNLVNSYINEAIAASVKRNAAENLQIDGVAYVNNSFYTTYNINSITEDENFIFKFSIPQIPIGVGSNEGIASVQFKDADKNLSYEAVILNMNQVSYLSSMRNIPNKVLVWFEGNVVYIKSLINLTPFKAKVRMISGTKDSNDINSELQVPDDSLPFIREYVVNQLIKERQQPTDTANDGINKV